MDCRLALFPNCALHHTDVGLPEDDTHMGDEILQTVNSLPFRSNAEVRMRADKDDAEAALDYGLK